MAKKKPKRSKRYQRNRDSRLPQLDAEGIDVPIEESINAAPEHSDLLDEESFFYERALEMHPVLLELDRADELPEEAIDENGTVWNVTMHLNIHSILENQLASVCPEIEF